MEDQKVGDLISNKVGKLSIKNMESKKLMKIGDKEFQALIELMMFGFKLKDAESKKGIMQKVKMLLYRLQRCFNGK